MEALQLALLAWHGLQLLLVMVGVGVEVATRPAAAAESVSVVTEPALPPLDDTWQFTMPAESELLYVRLNGAR